MLLNQCTCPSDPSSHCFQWLHGEVSLLQLQSTLYLLFSLLREQWLPAERWCIHDQLLRHALQLFHLVHGGDGGVINWAPAFNEVPMDAL